MVDLPGWSTGSRPRRSLPAKVTAAEAERNRAKKRQRLHEQQIPIDRVSASNGQEDDPLSVLEHSSQIKFQRSLIGNTVGLSFGYVFMHRPDQVWFASQGPVANDELLKFQAFVEAMQADPVKAKIGDHNAIRKCMACGQLNLGGTSDRCCCGSRLDRCSCFICQCKDAEEEEEVEEDADIIKEPEYASIDDAAAGEEKVEPDTEPHQTDLDSFLRQGFYEVLEVDPSATKTTLTKAFRKLCLLHHPDKGGIPAKFLFLKFAYDILDNPVTRALYDEHGRDHFEKDIPKPARPRSETSEARVHARF